MNGTTRDFLRPFANCVETELKGIGFTNRSGFATVCAKSDMNSGQEKRYGVSWVNGLSVGIALWFALLMT
jgi:hypothetical protein